ncbi:2-succinyl-5-enolpyruvyl-6-hydroxy-3-cyclohexene-1-carboxylic-acid synthase [Quadrisphaera sp. DSM 44207]|uniref:2-succinyl-5-enolpyruvyl-6-hydroxy-3- cyclohexene-1-carboxylic-acid synthase n=1 Tax=Quadrisphaera sp. DSM 44207 TaxID=1881057 RepID=UPI000881AC84|nr:2-succinyl-5-enolpyruvyl-6-hydroxy-3-cyclohexene-1-carboxylic-acid synthase [Quadrisphaera sp. DSM 44207]SDQ15265.1 2-succinyl-5-enolpyruvyl-6-hydroxy-3-cyclohexene-1-carboxylate synthase [Quadrisphaera sp. DSM 44207]
MNPSTLLARAVVDVLVAAGVREVVLSPGSRSAPLAYALHAADAAGRLRLHVRHDERAAAFTALGAGRAGVPAAVVTTSGTAVANLHPAVLEASEAGVPLLVLSADRPHAARGTWANQTTALQAGLFGAAVRTAADLPVPAPGSDLAAAVRAWQEAVAGAVRAAAGSADGTRPGPAHLDLAFDDPLVPDDDPPRSGASAATSPERSREGAPGAADVLTGLGSDPGRTVVVAGDGAGPLARDLAEAAGWPLLAEPTSGARSGANAVPAYRLLLARPDLGGAVERAVVLGRPTLSRPVARLLARDDVEVVQLVRHRHDPAPPRTVRRVVLPQLAAGRGPHDHDGSGGREGHDRGGSAGWLARWRAAGAAAGAAVDAVLDAEAAAGRLSGPCVARELAAALAPGDQLVAAASNPARDLDLAARPWAGAAPRAVANRGLSGIDGTLSTASGLALATGAPVRVLVGDLALLHDANGLLLPPGEPEPDLQVVVVNDDGGGIFTGLEHGEPARSATFERLFGTPHGADLAALAAALGVPHERAEDLAGLREALAAPVRGRSVVEVRVDRSRLRDLHARFADAVRAALAIRQPPQDSASSRASSVPASQVGSGMIRRIVSSGEVGSEGSSSWKAAR